MLTQSRSTQTVWDAFILNDCPNGYIVHYEGTQLIVYFDTIDLRRCSEADKSKRIPSMTTNGRSHPTSVF